MKEKIVNWFKKYQTQIITITLMVLVGSAMHFVTDIFNSDLAKKILGVIFPVNETAWEHMKMLWYPFLVAGIILSIKRKSWGYFGGFVIGGTLSIPLTCGLFAIYQSFTIHSVLIFDIILFIIVMVVCAMLAFDLANIPIVSKAKITFIVVAAIVTAILIFLTYVPGDGYIFNDNSGLEEYNH